METMSVAGLVSWLVALAIVRWQHAHAHFTSDDANGVQKFHAWQAARIGGVAVAGGLAALCGWLAWRSSAEVAAGVSQMLVAGVPVFAAGLAEDVTRRVAPRWRLIAALVSAALAWWWVGAQVVRADVPGLDGWLAAPWVSLLFTVVAVGAVTHAFNVIDGFNGLASMSAALILAAVGYVALQVGDWLVLTVALGGIGALLGFWFWNWPRGVIFLGDGGAYLTGFWVAEAVVLLVVRNNAVSPWFAVMVLAYPVTELLFSIWRKWRRGRSPMQPDGVHLHMLIFRRLVRWSTEGGEGPVGVWWRNAMTSPYLWALTVFSLLPAMLWWRSTPVLVGCVVAFVVGYGWMYRAIVRFRGQRWLRLRG